MGLYERLVGTDPAKIPVHSFMAALGEFERGKVTRSQIINAFGLSAAEETELDTLTALVRTPLESYALAGRVTLTNVGAAYDTTLDSQSLPFLYLQCAGITRVDLEVRVRKVGTGNQDWQLFDDTNAVAAIGPGALTTGSLTDTNGAGDHTLTASRTFAAPLTPGVRKMRLRTRSSVAADDPVFLAAALLIFRVDTLTADVLHHVLLLGEHGSYSVAQVKSRLGV